MKTKLISLLLVGAVMSPVAYAQHTAARPASEKPAVEKEESKSMQRPDAWVMAKVKSTFAVTSGVDATDISVSVNDGKVLLSGTVASTKELNEAKRVAQNVEGVRSVDTSKLVVQPESSDSRK